VVTDVSTLVDNQVAINFGGSTTFNSAILRGTWNGLNGSYRGGSGVDQVVMGATALDMFFGAVLDNGDDAFTLESNTQLDGLFVDFDGGDDLLVDLIGDPHPFPTFFFNL
jgi:hypothetical protein